MSLATQHHAFDRRPASGRVVFLIHPDREPRERLSAVLAAAGFRVLAAADAPRWSGGSSSASPRRRW